jgi:hypothetical protein
MSVQQETDVSYGTLVLVDKVRARLAAELAMRTGVSVPVTLKRQVALSTANYAIKVLFCYPLIKSIL